MTRKSTKEIRAQWIAEGCPIRPRRGHVVVVGLDVMDTLKSDIQIVTAKPRGGRMGEEPTWQGTSGQIVAVGEPEIGPDAQPFDDLRPGAYVTFSLDLGGAPLVNFLDLGANAWVLPAEACRAELHLPDQP